MLKNVVSEYIKQNRKIVVSLLICIFTGTLAGFFIYNFSDKEVKNILVEQMSKSIEGFESGEVIKTDAIYNAIKNNIWLIFFILMFSIMLYGTIFIYLIYLIKGLAIGIYVGTLFGVFGLWWGLLVILILVILVNIVYLPAIIFIGTTFINYNLNVIEYRKEVNKIESMSKVLFKVTFGVMIIFSSIIIEQLLSNIVIKISNYIQK